MADVVIPKYLDPNSMGGRVLDAQQQMLTDIVQRRLPGEAMRPTGVHAGNWSDFVLGLQLIWNIDADRGMGPQFRERYLKETGHDLLDPHGINMNDAPTIVYKPDQEFGQWIDGSQNIHGEQNKILETVHIDYRNNHGGDGGVSITDDSYDQIDALVGKHAETKPTILVIGNHGTRVKLVYHAWKGKVEDAWNGSVTCLTKKIAESDVNRLTWAVGSKLIVVRA